MCSVWISTLVQCDCTTLHVQINTFRVRAANANANADARQPFAPKGIEILHSTCRRLNMLPTKPHELHYGFCFLQEYEEFDHKEVIPPAKRKKTAMESPMSPHAFKTLACCSRFMNMPSSRAVLLDNSSVHTNKALYIICQLASRSIVYLISISAGRLACQGMVLSPHCTMNTFVCSDENDLMTRPLPWHFVRHGNCIYAVPRTVEEIYLCSFCLGTTNRRAVARPSRGFNSSIALVVQVGYRTIAITDTLQGFLKFDASTLTWDYHRTDGPLDLNLEMKVSLSGYVVLNDDLLMVSPAETQCCYLLDLEMNRWSVVEPFPTEPQALPFQMELLSLSWCGATLLRGRSIFVDGFVYTCDDGGLFAFELIDRHHHWSLGDQINLPFSWCKNWVGSRMCLDYVGKDTISGAIMFCVVQGDDYCPQHSAPSNHPLYITTVQVKTERMNASTLRPVRTDHVDISTCFVGLGEMSIWTRSCFAVDP